MLQAPNSPIAVFGPDGVVLADRARYYDLVNANLYFFDDNFTVDDLKQLFDRLQR